MSNGRTLEGEELEEFNEQFGRQELILCNGMSISLATTEYGDAVVIGMTLITDEMVLFGLKVDAIDGMIEGLEGAKQALKDRNNAN